MKTDSGKAVDAANVAARKAADSFHAGPLSRSFTEFSSYIARASGRPATFVLAFLTIVVWGITGPMFHYSDTWQLVINTDTTIIAFLMVFLIQNTQNRDGAAIQAKLDELIRAHHDARNAYMGIEKLPEEELAEMREHCAETAPDGEPRRLPLTPEPLSEAEPKQSRAVKAVSHDDQYRCYLIGMVCSAFARGAGATGEHGFRLKIEGLRACPIRFYYRTGSRTGFLGSVWSVLTQ